MDGSPLIDVDGVESDGVSEVQGHHEEWQFPTPENSAVGGGGEEKTPRHGTNNTRGTKQESESKKKFVQKFLNEAVAMLKAGDVAIGPVDLSSPDEDDITEAADLVPYIRRKQARKNQSLSRECSNPFSSNQLISNVSNRKDCQTNNVQVNISDSVLSSFRFALPDSENDTVPAVQSLTPHSAVKIRQWKENNLESSSNNHPNCRTKFSLSGNLPDIEMVNVATKKEKKAKEKGGREKLCENIEKGTKDQKTEKNYPSEKSNSKHSKGSEPKGGSEKIKSKALFSNDRILDQSLGASSPEMRFLDYTSGPPRFESGDCVKGTKDKKLKRRRDNALCELGDHNIDAPKKKKRELPDEELANGVPGIIEVQLDTTTDSADFIQNIKRKKKCKGNNVEVLDGTNKILPAQPTDSANLVQKVKKKKKSKENDLGVVSSAPEIIENPPAQPSDSSNLVSKVKKKKKSKENDLEVVSSAPEIIENPPAQPTDTANYMQKVKKKKKSKEKVEGVLSSVHKIIKVPPAEPTDTANYMQKVKKKKKNKEKDEGVLSIVHKIIEVPPAEHTDTANGMRNVKKKKKSKDKNVEEPSSAQEIIEVLPAEPTDTANYMQKVKKKKKSKDKNVEELSSAHEIIEFLPAEPTDTANYMQKVKKKKKSKGTNVEELSGAHEIIEVPLAEPTNTANGMRKVKKKKKSKGTNVEELSSAHEIIEVPLAEPTDTANGMRKVRKKKKSKDNNVEELSSAHEIIEVLPAEPTDTANDMRKVKKKKKSTDNNVGVLSAKHEITEVSPAEPADTANYMQKVNKKKKRKEKNVEVIDSPNEILSAKPTENANYIQKVTKKKKSIECDVEVLDGSHEIIEYPSYRGGVYCSSRISKKKVRAQDVGTTDNPLTFAPVSEADCTTHTHERSNKEVAQNNKKFDEPSEIIQNLPGQQIDCAENAQKTKKQKKEVVGERIEIGEMIETNISECRNSFQDLSGRDKAAGKKKARRLHPDVLTSNNIIQVTSEPGNPLSYDHGETKKRKKAKIQTLDESTILSSQELTNTITLGCHDSSVNEDENKHTPDMFDDLLEDPIVLVEKPAQEKQKSKSHNAPVLEEKTDPWKTFNKSKESNNAKKIKSEVKEMTCTDNACSSQEITPSPWHRLSRDSNGSFTGLSTEIYSDSLPAGSLNTETTMAELTKDANQRKACVNGAGMTKMLKKVSVRAELTGELILNHIPTANPQNKNERLCQSHRSNLDSSMGSLNAAYQSESATKPDVKTQQTQKIVKNVTDTPPFPSMLQTLMHKINEADSDSSETELRHPSGPGNLNELESVKRTTLNSPNPPSKKNKFWCTRCRSGFESAPSMLNHYCYQPPKGRLTAVLKESDDARFKCDCGKTFKNTANLSHHIQATHFSIRPFQCDECLMSFSEKQTLRVHQRIHSKTKPYKCRICDKRFITTFHLHRHYSRIHKLPADFPCGNCAARNLSFYFEDDLLNHRKNKHKGLNIVTDIAG